jgi:hypothetical protein
VCFWHLFEDSIEFSECYGRLAGKFKISDGRFCGSRRNSAIGIYFEFELIFTSIHMLINIDDSSDVVPVKYDETSKMIQMSEYRIIVDSNSKRFPADAAMFGMVVMMIIANNLMYLHGRSIYIISNDW